MKLIIHAGFSKTGSTAIQEALDLYAEDLQANRIFRLGSDLTVGSPGNPQWFIQAAARENPVQTLTDRISSALAGLPPQSTAIISSENLEFTHMPRLFAGLDQTADCCVVFYMRPQFSWTPSAWKQWYLKDGTTLPEYVESCLKLNSPGYLAALSAWKEALPTAQIYVRPVVKEYLAGGMLVSDFFRLIGSTMSPPDFRSNENLDYSLLHVMSRNASLLFSGPHDVAVEMALMEKLSSKYRATNAPMLNQAAASRIDAHFREENLTILREFSSIADPAEFLDRHMAPRIQGQAYIDMDEAPILARASHILTETFGMEAPPLELGSILHSLKRPEE